MQCGATRPPHNDSNDYTLPLSFLTSFNICIVTIWSIPGSRPTSKIQLIPASFAS